MFGLGYSRYMPGTVASFVTSFIYIILFILKVNIIPLLFFVSSILVYSIFIIDSFSNNFKDIDSKEIVIDEFIGQSIPILSIYFVLPKENPGEFIFLTFLAFILFRIFDIFKPYPINQIDKYMKNGFGVVFDDVMAGTISSIIILIIIFNFTNGL